MPKVVTQSWISEKIITRGLTSFRRVRKIDFFLSLDSYEPLHHLLTHQNSAVVANACGMLGNILKHSSVFYSTLQR